VGVGLVGETLEKPPLPVVLNLLVPEPSPKFTKLIAFVCMYEESNPFGGVIRYMH